MATCLNCGASVASDAKYCRSCGVQVSASASTNNSSPVATADDGIREAQPRKSSWADLGSVNVTSAGQDQSASSKNPLQHGQVQQVQQGKIQHGMSDDEKEKAARAAAAGKTATVDKKNSKLPILIGVAVVAVILIIIVAINPFAPKGPSTPTPSPTPTPVVTGELTVTKNVSTGGTATIVKGDATKGEATIHPKAGDTVYVQIVADSGYVLKKANIETEQGKKTSALTRISALDDEKPIYTFKMPSDNVKLNVQFAKK